jgi:iron complex outermembrane recepter protein
VWGCGYRNDEEALTFRVPPVFEIPNLDAEQIPSYFFQDTITLVEDRFYATIGSKFDHNTVTNFEYQPTAKLTYTPDERTSTWGAISRAVRTPSLLDRFLNTGLQSEDVLAYEAGYRRQSTDKLFWELAVFFNRYSKLITDAGSLTPSENIGGGDTYGFEYNTSYQVQPTWHLTGSYSFFVECIRYPTGAKPQNVSGSTPRNQFYIQSGWDLGHDVTFDVMFRYVDSLLIGVENYFVGDIRLAWRPTKRLELSLVGQDLFDGRHYEFANQGADNVTEVKPGVYGMVSWRY